MIRIILTIVLSVYFSGIAAQDKNRYNGCQLAKKVTTDTKFIKENAKLILKYSKDDCVLQLLDSLASRAKDKNDLIYWNCLESISAVSDGYVSEYFTEIGSDLFFSKFRQFFLILYNNHQKKVPNPLEKIMIEAVSMQISMAPDRKEMQKRIDGHVNAEIKKAEYTSDQIAYLSAIRSRFDPGLFD